VLGFHRGPDFGHVPLAYEADGECWTGFWFELWCFWGWWGGSVFVLSVLWLGGDVGMFLLCKRLTVSGRNAGLVSGVVHAWSQPCIMPGPSLLQPLAIPHTFCCAQVPILGSAGWVFPKEDPVNHPDPKAPKILPCLPLI
jgi:hypothetical protein